MNDDKSKTETNYTMGQESLDQLSKDKEIIDGKWFGFSIDTAHYASNYLHIHFRHEFNRINNRKKDQSEQEKIRLREFCRAIKKAYNGEILASTNGNHSSFIYFSFHEKLDYTPDDPNEEERIHEESGNIIRKSSKDILRVERRLAMTRVLGDFIIDKNIIPPIPDIIICSQGQSVAFVIRASNSIWNVMSNE
ncbi:unnamed protein product [Rotaria sp. Silwood1]|nr:unnamed protein product [Rotaria sp. Silwood1]